jgi:lipopolysaccharide export system permease protein
MFIIWRYILKEHVWPFFFGLSIITLVFLLNLIFRELGRILSRGLSAGVVAEFFFLNLAWILALAVPMAVLISTLMAFGKLSGDGEITAMKAGGIGVLNILTPVILASILITFFLIWFNNHVLPDANYRTKLLYSDISRKRPTLSLEPGVYYTDIEDYSILVEEIDERPDTSFVTNIYIEDQSDPNTSTYIMADRGKIFLNPQTGMLYMILFDGEMHELDLEKMEQYNQIAFPRQMLSISVPGMVMTRSEKGYRGDREKSAEMMVAEVTENKVSITEKKSRAAKLINGYFAKYVPYLNSDEVLVKETQLNIKNAKKSIYSKDHIRSDNVRLRQQLRAEMSAVKALDRENWRLLVEVHKKYSIPVACIVFVLVGAPLGIMSRRGNLAVAGGIAFTFFLIYWTSLIGGEELADNQIIRPSIAMWMANVLCGIGGIYLIFHSIHEATFIQWTTIGDFFVRLVSRKRKGI